MKKLWKYYDYGFDPYDPIAPVQGKLSSEDLLYNSLQASAYQKTFLLLVRRIKDAIGSWKTVWGVKLGRFNVTWEFYFYNHRDWDSRRTVECLLKVFRSCFKMSEFVDIGIEHQPYFMFSVDLSDKVFESNRIDGIHLYTQGRKGIFQGNSYYWGHRGIELENHYDFYLVREETNQFIDKLKQSVVFGKYVDAFLQHELVRQLLPCYRICVANKRKTDAIYFSRVNVSQLIFFLEYFSYPGHIIDFVVSREKKLNHLLYDVAFDCIFSSRGPVFCKSSYYGIF